MTWLRYDDRFTCAAGWDGVSYTARWHYVALVELCGSTGRYDGRLPLTLALRASDVPEPDGCLDELTRAGRVLVDGDTVTVLTIGEHIPPTYIRESAEKSKERMRRMRAHRNGDHSRCLPEHCPDATVQDDVTAPVTRNTGTGRDGTGEEQQLREGSRARARAHTHAGAGADAPVLPRLRRGAGRRPGGPVLLVKV
jgi:hypothetical protein